MKSKGNRVSLPLLRKAQALSQDLVYGFQLKATLFVSDPYFFLNWVPSDKANMLNIMETLMIWNLTIPQGQHSDKCSTVM